MVVDVLVERGQKVPRILRNFTLRKLLGINIVRRPEVSIPRPGGMGFEEPYGSALEWYHRETALNRDRLGMYKEYSEMDHYDIISSALDIYSEDATQLDNLHKSTVWIESEDVEIIKLWKAMVHELDLEEIIPGITRQLAKFGDHFEQILYNSVSGVFGFNFLPPEFVRVIEHPETGQIIGYDVNPENASRVNVPQSSITYAELSRDAEDRAKYQPFDILHFKISGARVNNLYGDALIRPARKIWKQLKLMEDATILYRINRAPDRLLFKIDVGRQTGTAEAFNILSEWRKWFKKRQFHDPTTGEYRAENNPMAMDEDLFIATTPDSTTDVTRLAGSVNAQDVADLEYFRDRLFAALRIPKAYMGFEGDINAKATLAQQDIRFARTIKRVQRAIIVGMTRLFQIHLAFHFEEEELKKKKFKVMMSPISYLDELQRAELWSLKLDMARQMTELGLDIMQLDRVAWLTYILSEFLQLSDRFIQHLITIPLPEPLPPEGGAGGGPGGGDLGMGGEFADPAAVGIDDMPPAGGEEIGGAIPPDELGAVAPSIGNLDLASQRTRAWKPHLDQEYVKSLMDSTKIEGETEMPEDLVSYFRAMWQNSPVARRVQEVNSLVESEAKRLDVELAKVSQLPLPGGKKIVEGKERLHAAIARIALEETTLVDEEEIEHA